MTFQEIFAQVQNVTYSDAIKRYNFLKTKFFMDYSIAAEKEEKELIKQFEQEIVTDINNNPIEDQEILAEDLYQWVENAIVSKLEGVKQNQQNNNFKSLYNKSKKQGTEEGKKLIQKLITPEELKQQIESTLRASGIIGFSTTDILNQVVGFRNRLNFTKKTKNYYLRSTKGYFREAIVFKAFSKLGDYLDSIPVMGVGSKNNSYDLYIDFFNNIEKSMNLAITDSVDIGYGVQSKSWIAPWENNATTAYFQEKYGFSVGSRSNLLSQSGLKGTYGMYNYLKGILFLEKNATAAIGEQQLGYVTGTSFYWTADLIEHFRAMNYFLVFGLKNDLSLSANIAWNSVKK